MVSQKMNILIGVCGGIALYKVLSLIRLFQKMNHSVKVIMTKNAKEFVTPLSFEAISGNPVYDEMFSKRDSSTLSNEFLTFL